MPLANSCPIAIRQGFEAPHGMAIGTWASRLPVALGLLLALCVEFAASLLPGDACWDTRNYHLYNPYALLHKAWGTDFGPAHMQTWFSPTMDLPFYLLMRHVTVTPLLNLLLAIPHAVSVVLLYVLARRLLQVRTVADEVLAFAAVLIGATGAATTSTLATSMDEALPICSFLGALLVLLPADGARLPSARRLLLAGLLAGAGCGLKLTFSYAAIGLGAGVLFIPRRRLPDLILRPAALALGGAVGAALLSGYWWLHQWEMYGNPVYPLMNDVFRSPLAPIYSYVDPTFLPQSWPEALAVPWNWALQLNFRVGESRLRDPRFALGIIAAVLCLVQFCWQSRARRAWPAMFVAVWLLISFALWRHQFSIFRYLGLFEMLTGPLIAMAARAVAERVRWPTLAPAATLLLVPALLAITVVPGANRSPRGTPPLQVAMDRLPPDAMVLILDRSPLAYLALFQPASVRFLAVNDWFVTADSPNHPAAKPVRAAIAGQKGELWGLDTPAEWGFMPDPLPFYGLVRGECRPVVSNLSPNPVRFCRLLRQG